METLNLSSYKTIDSDDEITIEYSDVYIYDNKIIYNTNKKIDIPRSSTWNGVYFYNINQQELPSNLIIDNIIDIAVIQDNLFYGNIGHALWDGLYPAYVSLFKFGYNESDFTYITNNVSNKDAFSYPIMETFSGNTIMNYLNLPNKIIHIKKLIVGIGKCGNLVMRKDYTLYGNKWNALKLFRDRIYKKHNVYLKLPNKTPNIIWIENKRYNTQELKIIEKLCIEYNINFIQYNKIGKFKDHLEYFSNVDIQITGPGTGMMYAPFMKDSGVIVNVGWMEHPQTNTARPNIFIQNCNKNNYIFPSYMEQSVLSSIYWASILYYDRYKYNEIEYESGREIIEKAIYQYNTGIKKEKHAIDAQIFIEYCTLDENSDDVCLDLTNKALFCEMMVNEHPLAIEKINIDLLREIRKKHGYDEKYVYSNVI